MSGAPGRPLPSSADVPSGAPGPAAGEPPPPPGFDLFGSSPIVRFIQAANQEFLGSFQIFGSDEHTALGDLRRDGEGWRVFEMNFSLDNPSGKSVYRIRMPAPPAHGIGFGHPFSLQDPFGTEIGELSWKIPNRASLTVAGGRTYTAQVIQSRSPFAIETSGRTLAEATYIAVQVLRSPRHFAGLELRFTPACGEPAERSLVVAFAAYIVSMASPGRLGIGGP